ncbi:MAG: hypothetical protein ABI723_11375 [Bacteroidia bacterium]
MGLFLSLSGIIGKSSGSVINSLANYAKSVNGGLQPAAIDNEHENFCVVKEANGNSCILYPFHYTEWDNSSKFISRELQAPVFSCHIHDEDLWMFVVYNNGEVVSQFNPVPDYWDDNISQKEIDKWKGDANTVCKYVRNCKPADIEKYLKRWNLDDEPLEKAYKEDEFTLGDCWQLIDFLNKLGISYPLDNEGNPTGQVFKLWTSQLKLEASEPKQAIQSKNNPAQNKSKPWWKFW